MAEYLKRLHVAVGVIKNSDGKILISKRADAVHQGGLWEFPGGKVESGELVQQALQRELDEELGIQVQKSEPLIKISHQYPDLSVLLDVWRVNAFSGQAHGCEGQDIKWVGPQQLAEFDFPAANRPIIKAATLPSHYAILEGRDEHQVLSNLSIILEQGIKLIQVRLKLFASSVSVSLLEKIMAESIKHEASLLINSALKHVNQKESLGIHLTSSDLLNSQTRPEGYQWVAASCHNLQELQWAEKIAADFVVLAPVQKTASHPETIPMGWQKFTELTLQSNLPVYALGGLQRSDLEQAMLAGAQGIAGISTFLK